MTPTPAPERPKPTKSRSLNNVTPYYACYIGLAKSLGCRLLTTDARFVRAPGIECPVELM